jgi:hypothetical protein
MFCLVKRIEGGKFEDIASRDDLQESEELAKFFNSYWPGEYFVRECPGGKCTFTRLYDPTRLPKPPLSESGQTKFDAALLRLAGRLACTAFPYLGRIVRIAHERFERRALYGR